MTKQEFMAMSLHYGLKIQTNDKCIETVKGIIGDTYCITDFPKYGMYGDCVNANIILHPLSDLTKPIEHNGEKFVPIEMLQKKLSLEWCGIFDESVDFITEFWNEKDLKDKVLFLPHLFINYFIELHFDIAGLIEKGEAINVNSLETNPYK